MTNAVTRCFCVATEIVSDPQKEKKKREKKKKNVRWIDEMSPFLGRDAVEILTKKKFFFFQTATDER